MSKPRKYGMITHGIPNNRRPAKAWKPHNRGREWTGAYKEGRDDGKQN